MRLFIFIFTFCVPVLAVGQTQTFAGRVSAADGEPLAFVSVIAQGTEKKVVFSDIDGTFQVQINGPEPSITFRYVGFEELTLSAATLRQNKGKPLRVTLKPSDTALNTVDIFAGENPADILMRKVIANRHRNNPERSGSYQCKTYNKVSMEALPNAKEFHNRKHNEKQARNFEQTQQEMAERHLFFMETVTERRFLAPHFIQEKVLLNRVSGFKDAALVTLANAVQPFTFYGDFLPIMEKKFVNPVSPGSTKLYFFSLEDTLFNDEDTIWVVRFKPRKGKVFRSLKGTLHIHSNQYAVQNVIAQPSFGNENLNMVIEQAYTFVPIQNDTLRGQWFPQQLNFELTAARYPSPEMGVKASGHSYITDAEPQKGLKLSDFNPEQPLFIENDAFSRDSAAWEQWQQFTPLSRREQQTYQFLDSLGAVKRFDRVAKVFSAWSTLVWPINQHVGIDLNQIFRLNEYETLRLGIGFTNAQHRPLGLAKRLEWGVGAGFGFKDQRLKYNGYGLWRIHRGRQTQLRLDVQRDLFEPGAPYEMETTAFIDRSLYAQRMDFTDEVALRFSTRMGKVWSTSVTARRQQMRPAEYLYSYQADENTLRTSRFTFNEVTGIIRYAYGEQVRQFLGNSSTVQRWPVVEVAATQGFGDYQYRRFLGALYQSVFIPRLGYCRWRLEGGWVSGNAPLAKLFTLNQSAGGYTLFAINQTFQSLPDTLFLHNRFANLFFQQEFGPILYQKRYSAPFLTLIHNMSVGNLAHRERHLNIGFLTMQRPYIESGIQLDNILRINYVRLGWVGVGGAVFYRWGAYSDGGWRQNVAPRLSLRFTF